MDAAQPGDRVLLAPGNYGGQLYIRIAGNLVVGGASAVSWVNIDGGVVCYNYFRRPATWVMRMLNENAGNPLVLCPF